MIPIGALAVAMLVFGVFMAVLRQNPLEVYALIYRGGFASAFSWQNTLSRAAPLVLTALCVAVPAQAGLMVIGGEGALVLGGLAAAVTGHLLAGAAAGGSQAGDGRRGDDRGRSLDRAGRRAPAIPRRERDDLEPAPHLYRHRRLQPRRRGPAARSGESQQALDRPDRRRQHAGPAPRPRRPLGIGLGHHLLRGDGGADAAHHAGLRAPHRGGQCARGPPGRPARRAARALRVLPRRGGGGAGRHGGGGGRARQRQCLARRRLRVCRDPRRLHRPPESARHRAGRDPAGRHLGQRRHAAAPPRPSRCDRARSAGRGLPAHPGERDPVRAVQGLPDRGRHLRRSARRLRLQPGAGPGRRRDQEAAGRHRHRAGKGPGDRRTCRRPWAR